MDNRYNNFWRRIFAATIDEIILIPLSLLIGYIDVNTIYTFVVTSFTYSLLYSFYFIYLHKKYGKTIGKKLLSIEVMSADETHRISFLQSIKRDGILFAMDNILIMYFSIIAIKENVIETSLHNYTTTVSICSIGWILIEILTMIFNKKRRALNDYLGNTVVIKTS